MFKQPNGLRLTGRKRCNALHFVVKPERACPAGQTGLRSELKRGLG